MEITINNSSPYPSHADPLHYSSSAASTTKARAWVFKPHSEQAALQIQRSNGTLIYQEEKSPSFLPVVVLEQDQLPGLTKLAVAQPGFCETGLGRGAIISCDLPCSVCMGKQHSSLKQSHHTAQGPSNL